MDISEFKDSFESMKDFREAWKVKHKLTEILFIAVVATIANANSWIEIASFAEVKEDLLKKYIPLENGIPSHDTFKRVFENIDSNEFNRCFMNWTSKLSDNSNNRIIAIDGKTVRRSHDGEKSAIHIVNAWVDENNLILGQLKTHEKSNEITAIPELMELLFLKGSIVTIDAMGTQKKIAEKIIEKKGDYVLSLKGNQNKFYDEVKEYFEDNAKNNFREVKISKKVTLEKNHGRIEKREYTQTNDIEWFSEKHLWKKLSSIGKVKRTVTYKDRTTEDICYYISSLKMPKDGECDLFAKAVRKHWGVESSHWILDVVFKEDDSRVRKNNGAANQSMLKKIALNILKTETITKKKTSLNMKRFRAGIDETFLGAIIDEL